MLVHVINLLTFLNVSSFFVCRLSICCCTFIVCLDRFSPASLDTTADLFAGSFSFFLEISSNCLLTSSTIFCHWFILLSICIILSSIFLSCVFICCFVDSFVSVCNCSSNCAFCSYKLIDSSWYLFTCFSDMFASSISAATIAEKNFFLSSSDTHGAILSTASDHSSKAFSNSLCHSISTIIFHHCNMLHIKADIQNVVSLSHHVGKSLSEP